MTRRLFAAVCSASLLPLLASAPAHAAFSYGTIGYTDVADSFPASTYSQFAPFPSINDAGQIGFAALTHNNVLGVYVTASAAPGAPTVVASTDAGGGGFSDLRSPTLNNDGVAAFSGTGTAGQGIFTGAIGSSPVTVSDASTATHPYFGGGTPRVTDLGAVVFLGTNGPGYPQFTIKSGAAYTPVVAYDGSQFEFLYDAAINATGQVAFNTDDYSTGHNNGAFVYRYAPGSGIQQIGRATSTTAVSINDDGMVAYEGSAASGSQFPTTGIFASDGITATPISLINQPLPGTSLVIDGYAANGEGIAINNAGMVAFMGSDNAMANYGIYVGDGTSTAQVVHLGQTMFGRTVNGFELGRDAINDAGQVTFNVSFTDGTSAIVRTTGVPEPTAATLFAGTGLVGLVARRRRTRITRL